MDQFIFNKKKTNINILILVLLEKEIKFTHALIKNTY